MICPTDAENIGIDHKKLEGRPSGEVSGFGGKCRAFLEEGVLYFKGSNENVRLSVRTEILEPYEGSDHLPSIVGRDVLHSWKMIYEPLNETDPLVFYCNDRKLLW